MPARLAAMPRTQSPRVRPARPGDIDAFCGLLAALFDIEADFAFDAARARKAFGLLLAEERACVLTALHDGEVAGMCSGQIVISTSEGGPSVVVEDVVVREDARGLGLGRELLRAVERWGLERGATRLQLLADRDNSAGLDFYDHLGWRRTSLICLRRHPASEETLQGERA
ncbi:GNAT family N-acetyltransferase [Paucidesulfovibrio longus]|uniref:GNAT family N-acetyltransferase n=1 Tax=Paucidesulfovibrio longus TaxID=889 RepID=UPI0003B6DD33|nr:GNAT family N-acetyltransferase [Paucidesulfovibrio longus]